MNIKRQHKALKEELSILKYKMLNSFTKEQAKYFSQEYMEVKKELEKFEQTHKEQLL